MTSADEPLTVDMSDADMAEALDLARRSLGNGGQRTLLAKALLHADAEVRRLNEFINYECSHTHTGG